MPRRGVAISPCRPPQVDPLSPEPHARHRTAKRFPCSSLTGGAAGLLERRLKSGFADSNRLWLNDDWSPASRTPIVYGFGSPAPEWRWHSLGVRGKEIPNKRSVG